MCIRDSQYITQIGTGNYNEKTAALYTDLCLMTGGKAIGKDAAEFFKNMSIGNLNGLYDHLIVSPTSLKQKVLYLMDEEIRKGTSGRIVMKMNSLTDVDFIEKLARASQAGVKVDSVSYTHLRESAKLIAAQLLRALQQLCTGISERLF